MDPGVRRVDLDATPAQVPIADGPLWVGFDNTNRVCLAVDNAIPACPDQRS